MLHKKEGNKAILYSLVLCLFSISVLVLYPNKLFYTINAAAQTSPVLSPNYLLHADPTYQIKIQYPEDWRKVEGSLLAIANAYTNNTIALAQFDSPDRSVSVVVTVKKLMENLTLEQYIPGYIASLTEYDTNPQIVEQNRTTTLAGTHGYKLVHTGTVDPGEIIEGTGMDELIGRVIEFQPTNRTTLSFIALTNNNVFSVIYTDASAALNDQICTGTGLESLDYCASFTNIDDPYTSYLPVAQQMINSIEITTQNQTVDNDNTNLTIPNYTVQPQPNNETQTTNEDVPCTIIDRRLAIGNITEEEYERLHEILQC